MGIESIEKGRVVFMAREGTRKYDPGNPPRARTGFVRLAQEADCPVVPVACRRDKRSPAARSQNSLDLLRLPQM